MRRQRRPLSTIEHGVGSVGPRTAAYAGVLLAVLSAGLVLAEGPPSTQTCCNRVVLTEQQVLAVDWQHRVWARPRTGGQWRSLPLSVRKAHDLARLGDALWMLELDGPTLQRIDIDGATRSAVPAPEGAWSLGSDGHVVWVVGLGLPGTNEIRFWQVAASGEARLAGVATVPLSASEKAVFEATSSHFRLLMSLVRLASGSSECAAFFTWRDVFVPCCQSAAPLRWVSRGAELANKARDYEKQHHRPAVPLPALRDVVGTEAGWWVLEGVTEFDPGTGNSSGRDRVRLLGRDGTFRGEVKLGGPLLGLAQEGDVVYALGSDGSLRPIPPPR